MIILGAILVILGLVFMLTIIGAPIGIVLFLLGLGSMLTGAALKAARRSRVRW